MITSRSNAQVKYVRRLLAERRFRHEEGAFVVEGTRWLGELAAAGVAPRALYATPAWAAGDEEQALLAALGVEPALVEEPVMAAMSDTETASGVLAVLPMSPRPLPAAPTLLIILDAINNPGNLGTILRTAAAAGADGVLLGPGSVDPYNPKVVRGSMGAILRLPVWAENWEVIHRLTDGLDVWLAAARDGWLRLDGEQGLRTLLNNAFGVRLDIDYDGMDGSCPECRRRFVFATHDDGRARLKLRT